jgi:hypothetical protein
MVELLSHPIWDGIGAIIGFVALVMALMQWTQQRRERGNKSADYLDQPYRPLSTQHMYPEKSQDLRMPHPAILGVISLVAFLIIFATPTRPRLIGGLPFRPELKGEAKPTPTRTITVTNHLILPISSPLMLE